MLVGGERLNCTQLYGTVSRSVFDLGYKITVNRDNKYFPKATGLCRSENSLLYSLKGWLDDKLVTSIVIEFERETGQERL